MPEMSDETKQMIVDFQNHQQQLQNIVMQKDSVRLQSLEIDRALEEINASSQKTAYKITGGIMIAKPAEDLKKDLEETKEALSIRLKSLEKNEQKLTDQLKELQEKLKEVIK